MTATETLKRYNAKTEAIESYGNFQSSVPAGNQCAITMYCPASGFHILASECRVSMVGYHYNQRSETDR
jgi:hypothetical protein